MQLWGGDYLLCDTGRDMDREDDTQADAAPGPAPSRRAALLGGAAIAVAGAGGVAAGVLTRKGRTTPRPRPAPGALVDALRAEESLVADATAALAADASLRPLVTQIRRDHQAHVAALRAALAPYDPPATAAPPGAAPGSNPTSPAPRGRSGLRTREQQAASAGTRRALRLDGRAAALVASIAACEAGHGELLA